MDTAELIFPDWPMRSGISTMQWMFMLIGLLLGWILDESFSDALLGALLGLGIGQAVRMARMDLRAVEQQRLLEQAQVALQAIDQRLALFEASGVKAPETRESLVSPETLLDEVPAAAPELIWDCLLYTSPSPRD